MKEYAWICGREAGDVTEDGFVTKLRENQIFAACIWEKDFVQEVTFAELLLDERFVEKGFFVSKNILRDAGGINYALNTKRAYEAALRVAEKAGVYLVPKQWMKTGEIGDENLATEEVVQQEDGFFTDAYVIGRYSHVLREVNLLESVLTSLLEECYQWPDGAKRQQYLEEMLSHTGAYYRIYDNTQPILIYLGPTYCYNILNVFAYSLGEALEKLGCPVEYYHTQEEDIAGLIPLCKKRYKASVGFQTWIMSVKRKEEGAYLQDLIGGPKYNFVVDHPIWLDHQLREVPEHFSVCTHDRNYVEFIKKYYPKVKNIYLLPPGGREKKMSGESVKKEQGVTFLGTYGDYRKKLAVIADCVPRVKFLAAKFLLFMTKNPEWTAEEAFAKALEHYGMHLEQEAFLKLFGEMKMVIQCVMYYYREKVIATLLKEDIIIHVYGESWREAPFAKSENLQIHDAVEGENSLVELQKSVISLNIMAWHKDGFTERIADSMLAKAVVVSDVSKCLLEDYQDVMALFSLKEIEKLPFLVKSLLNDEKRREMLSDAAYKIAHEKHTWERRAKNLLEIVEKEEY